MSAMPGPVDRRGLEMLKIAALSSGVRVGDEVLAYLVGKHGDTLSIHEYPTTGGLTVELPDGVFLNAPFDEPYCRLSPVVLAIDADSPEGLALRLGDLLIPIVRYFPLPGYLDALDSHGRPVTDVAMSHLDRVRVSPLAGCAYDCAFCDLPSMAYTLRPAEQVVEAMTLALADPTLPARHVLISGGSPRKAHYDAFEEVCLAVIDASPVPVDIMMSPMVDNIGFVDRVVSAGASGFAINIELASAPAALQHLGRKYKTSRRHFAEFVEAAVAATGTPGAVRSLIIPGLEPVEETLRGVETIAATGADPVLSPFRPAAGTRLSDAARVPADDLELLLRESRAITEGFGVALGPRCLPCQHNTLTFPWDVA